MEKPGPAKSSSADEVSPASIHSGTATRQSPFSTAREKTKFLAGRSARTLTRDHRPRHSRISYGDFHGHRNSRPRAEDLCALNSAHPPREKTLPPSRPQTTLRNRENVVIRRRGRTRRKPAFEDWVSIPIDAAEPFCANSFGVAELTGFGIDDPRSPFARVP